MHAVYRSYDMEYYMSLIGPDKHCECKIVNIFLSISLKICFGCSKEPSHRDGSFDHPQHIFWLRKKKIKFYLHVRTFIRRPA